jgi:hypothetical protein
MMTTTTRIPLILVIAGLLGSLAAGCHRGRLVYTQSRGEVVSTLAREDFKNVAAELGETLVTEGETWRLEAERPAFVRVSHAQPRHLTYIDIYFYDSRGGGSTYAAEGWSRAMGGFWTGGITDTATQGIAKPKIRAFLDELNNAADAR